jgi:hypothetical protein
VVRGERETRKKKRTSAGREGEKRGGKRRERWGGSAGVGLDGTHTLIEGRQLTTAIQSTKRRGAGQVDPLHASIAETEERKKKPAFLVIFVYQFCHCFRSVITG